MFVVDRCPSADQLAGFVAGELALDERGAFASHLDACAPCRRSVSALAAAGFVEVDATQSPGGDGEGDAGLAPGQRLGRFALTRRLGHGAMGEVWAARDPELDREVALKLLRLRTEALSPHATDRLRREAQAMARLNHPNVVSIYELGRAGARVFCAMELVDGITLRAWLATPRSWREVLEVALAIAQGLAAAHAAGLVHRDVKPENVLMSRDGRTLVTDFGLAKLAGPSDDDEPAPADQSPALDGSALAETIRSDDAGGHELTAVGALVGTPAYMAPEQLDRRGADLHSDQFSYCVMIYEALFGVRPFTGTTIGELRAAVRAGAPRPARLRGVPRRILRCLARGLEADPGARWPSMSALAAELASAMPRRRGRVVGALAIVAALAATAVVATRGHGPREDDARAAAERRIAQAWGPLRAAELRVGFAATGNSVADDRAASVVRALDAYRADWLAVRLDAWAATHVRGEQTLALLERRVACLDRLADAMDALVTVLSHPTAAEVARAPDLAYRLEPVATCSDPGRLNAQSPPPSTPAGHELERNLRTLEALQVAGRREEALRTAEAMIRDAEAVGDPSQRARARYNFGVAQANAGHHQDAEATLRRALEDAANARDHYLVAAIWIRLYSLVGLDLGHAKAAADIEPAVRAAVAQAGDDPRQRADLAFTLGLVAAGQGDYAVARDRFVEARTRRIAILGAEHPIVANTESNLAAMLMHLGELDEATRLLQHARGVVSGALGENHPLIAQIEQNLAAIATRRKDFVAAVRHDEQALAVDVAVLGDSHPETGHMRLLLALALREQHALADAHAQLAKARPALASSPAELARLELTEAQLDEAEGNGREAEQHARTGVDVLRHGEPAVAQLAYSLAVLARIVAHRAPGEALSIYDEALRLHISQPSRDESGDAETLEELATVALAAHRPAAALAWFDRMPKAGATLAAVRARLERAR